MIQLLRRTAFLCWLMLCSRMLHAQLLMPPDTLVCKGAPITLRAQITSAVNTTHYAFEEQPAFHWDTLTNYTSFASFKDDEIKGPLPIGFTFSFLCGEYTEFYLGSNGWISFGVKNDISWHPKPIPSTFYEVPKNAILGPWEDWNPAKGGEIIYGVKGTAPNRSLVVSWIDVPMYSCPLLKGTFQIVIHESTNLITNNIVYKPASAGCNTSGTDATQGVHNSNGTVAFVVPGRNATLWTTSYESINFIPDIDSSLIVWTAGDKDAASTKMYYGPVITVSPDSTVDYRATLYKCSGGVVEGRVKVKVIPAVVSTLLNHDTTICKGQQVMLQATGTGGKPQNYQYNWLNDHTRTTTGTHTVQPDSTQVFKLVLTDQCSVSDTDLVKINVLPPLKLHVFKDSTLCYGRSIDIAPKDSGGSDSTRFIDWGFAVAAHEQFAPKQDTVIRVLLKDNCTVKPDTALIILNVRAPLHVRTIADTTLCHGDTLVLKTTASGGDTAHYTFSWDQGIGIGNKKIFAPDSSRTYRVVLNDACTPKADTDEVYVRVRYAPSLQVRSDSTICKGQQVLLFAEAINGDTDGVNFTWDHQLGKNNFIRVTPDSTTLYAVQLHDACLHVPPHDSVLITVRPPLHVQVADTIICYGSTVNLVANGTGGNEQDHQYHWSTGNDGQVLFGVQPLSTTTYRVVLQDNCTKKPDTADVTVQVRDPLKAALPHDTIVCEGTQLLLQALATGGLGTYTYTWNGIAGTGSLLLPAGHDTSIVLRIDDACSLPASDTVNVQIEAQPEADFNYTALSDCGKAIMGFSQQSRYLPGAAFSWTFDDGTQETDSNTQHTFLLPGKHLVSMRLNSARGCTDSVAKEVNVIVKPAVHADFSSSAETVNLLDPRIRFTSLSPDTLKHEWIFGNTGFSSSLRDPQMIFDATGAYLVMLVVQSKDGCTDTAGKWVNVEDLYTLYVPNSFSPNNDGVNDLFEAHGRGVKTFKMYILERGGGIIFESGDMKNGWNGRLQQNGDLPLQHVFVYKIITTDLHDEAHEYMGTVTMLK